MAVLFEIFELGRRLKLDFLLITRYRIDLEARLLFLKVVQARKYLKFLFIRLAYLLMFATFQE